ncbi:hypothetical protein [Paraburkholderia rhynchosiae]|uniref:Uncharacterized protein n=1 Tax=Paraburkholderia rhynchosiae TaxID=487049 RepID=A0A2N7WH45_9BURK|nr:hypothetical protein [Paraburkholderia rhynchosiae]PMS28737.1 hypothetical protein C0Z16_21680 [Paraburkholderia rhynchosiae]CAB3657921.1 hypothetical protein LMG27174_01514 [Paraburkholderia rhynchosiae]
MKNVTGSIWVSMSAVVAALMIGATGVAHAQPPGDAGGSVSGAGAAAATSVGTGAGASPIAGLGTSVSATRGIGWGPALNNMRANGTSLYMNPDPRAPNVTGRATPPR